jgi:hypothetical protein
MTAGNSMGFSTRPNRLRTYADSAYRSAETEAKFSLRGLRSRIHHRANRHHPLSQAQENANREKSRGQARIEHVFGAQQNLPGGRIVRMIGIARAKAKIGLQDLAHNIRRLVTLELPHRGVVCPARPMRAPGAPNTAYSRQIMSQNHVRDAPAINSTKNRHCSRCRMVNNSIFIVIEAAPLDTSFVSY